MLVSHLRGIAWRRQSLHCCPWIGFRLDGTVPHLVLHPVWILAPWGEVMEYYQKEPSLRRMDMQERHPAKDGKRM